MRAAEVFHVLIFEDRPNETTPPNFNRPDGAIKLRPLTRAYGVQVLVDGAKYVRATPNHVTKLCC